MPRDNLKTDRQSDKFAFFCENARFKHRAIESTQGSKFAMQIRFIAKKSESEANKFEEKL